MSEVVERAKVVLDGIADADRGQLHERENASPGNGRRIGAGPMNAAFAESLVNFLANDNQEWAEGYDQAERDEFVATIPDLLTALRSKGIDVVTADCPEHADETPRED